MDKEQMLEWVKEALRNKRYWHERKHHAEFDFDLFLQDLEQILNSLSDGEDSIRPMTPLEHQWMDFKKILSELVLFQEEYEYITQDKCPGNKYYADKLMAIVTRAKSAINPLPAPPEDTNG